MAEIPIIGQKKEQVLKPNKENPPLKIAISIPTHDYVPAGFMYSLANMTTMMGAALMGEGYADIAMNMLTGTLVMSGREELAQRALEIGATHMLWLDSDHKFPKDSVFRLLQHNKDIVGVNYVTRRFPPSYVAYKEMDFSDYENRRTFKKLITKEDSTGLEKVAAIGFGMVLMRTSVLLDLPKPWFDLKWIGPGAQWIGEDVHFCNLLTQAGYDIWVDHDLSKEVSHTGTMDYRLEHAEVLLDEGLEVEGDWRREEEEQNDSDDVQRPTDGDWDLAKPDGSVLSRS